MNKKTTERKTAPRRRKASGKKRAPAQQPGSPERKYELWGLFLTAVSLISICGLCGLNVGFVGLYFAKCLNYMFGVGAVDLYKESSKGAVQSRLVELGLDPDEFEGVREGGWVSSNPSRYQQSSKLVPRVG